MRQREELSLKEKKEKEKKLRKKGVKKANKCLSYDQVTDFSH